MIAVKYFNQGIRTNLSDVHYVCSPHSSDNHEPPRSSWDHHTGLAEKTFYGQE